ncbi:MAG: hypothetical protein CMF42_02900 [Legionellales bacterium]|nr:hypothetical protein [Legionellales bacterium]OUX67721.1 MAG: hypothetical protein CBD38_01765 [bacterium TMED178]|tara:strand:+ start:5735 stop:6094 length:360 start_codon:yes stop_codon:yes gene_type:complete
MQKALITLITASTIGIAHAYTSISSSLAGVISLFTMISQIFTGMAYIVGLMLFIAAIMKFRQYRENPQQVQIGQPLTLFGLSVTAIFLPGFLNLAGVFFGGQSVGAGATNTSVLPGGSS